jgi:hypothetical protein
MVTSARPTWRKLAWSVTVVRGTKRKRFVFTAQRYRTWQGAVLARNQIHAFFKSANLIAGEIT